jgi:1-aminocyclopropane-1-carboxylate deaminase/D-cysteine desulfhydrase-like pyridoxal-dependent ACC family enzyme
MSWTAETDFNDDWINITSGVTGTGAGTISVNYEENNESNARIGTITVTSPEAFNSPQTVEMRQGV